MPAVYKKLIKEVITKTPKQYFPPDEDGEGRTIQVGRLVGNLMGGGSTSYGQSFAGVKELIDGLPSAAAKDAAGLVTDLVELSYLKGIRDIRVQDAKEYGDEDAAQVGARIDAQIKDVEASIRDGVASFPRSIASDIAKRVNDAIKDADDQGQKRRGEYIQAYATKSFKKVLNDIYEGLASPTGSRAQSEYVYRQPTASTTRTSIMPERTPTYSPDELRRAKADQKLAREGGLMEGPGAAAERARRIAATEAANKTKAAGGINSIFDRKDIYKPKNK